MHGWMHNRYSSTTCRVEISRGRGDLDHAELAPAAGPRYCRLLNAVTVHAGAIGKSWPRPERGGLEHALQVLVRVLVLANSRAERSTNSATCIAAATVAAPTRRKWTVRRHCACINRPQDGATVRGDAEECGPGQTEAPLPCSAAVPGRSSQCGDGRTTMYSAVRCRCTTYE